MPGLIGFVRNSSREGAERLLSAMALALEPDRALYRTETFSEERAGLGRVSLGVLNPEDQPVWNRDRTVCIFLEGEIWNAPELEKDAADHEPELPVDSDARLLLKLFQIQGESFASRVNGAFIAAFWDRRSATLTLINDRLGLYPLYYAQVSGDLLFSSGLRGLLTESELSREVDPQAIAEFLTFDHVLDDRTFLSGVRLLPQASALTFDASKRDLRIFPYWRLSYSVRYERRSEQELLERLKTLLRQAVARQTRKIAPAALLLSGGLDSRVILAHLEALGEAETLHCLTWGIPRCDDARIAKELAALAGTRHHFVELGPDFLLRNAVEAVRRTDGLGNLVNLHALCVAETAARETRIAYKGFLGDAMLGFAVQRRFWADYESETSVEVHQDAHRFNGVLNYSQQELASFCTGSFHAKFGDSLLEAYREGMRRSGSEQLAVQRLYFDLTQRVPRMTLNGVEVVRGRLAVRLPFADADLVEFSTQLPPGYHFQRHMVRTAFLQSFPKFAKVPLSDTGLPMLSCARDVYLRSLQVARWHLNRTGIRWLQRPSRRPYKDYAAWFRMDLKDWVQELLLDRRTLDRGYFKPDSIKALVSEHMAGADHAVRLGALLTLEMWHREFLE